MNSTLQRLAALFEAFVGIAAERRDLDANSRPSPPPLGLLIRLQTAPWSARVELLLSLQGARLARWDPGSGAPDLPAVSWLDVDLSDGFRYDCLVFPDAASLARTLFSRMQYELAAPRGAPHNESSHERRHERFPRQEFEW